MGNEGSQPVGLEIEEKAIEATDAWTLHYASISGGTPRLSVFVGQSQEGKNPALELSAKNLMLYRHPSIVRYISSWQRGDCWNLATEEVKPLAEALPQLTSIQVCLGLHSVLKALVFLHEKAEASHNNVCCASIYVSPDGTWKLCGFENLCRFKDLTLEFMRRIRPRRYERAIAPEEENSGCVKGSLSEPWSIDVFAFGVLGEEVLRPGLGRSFGGTINGHELLPALTEFKELLKKNLQSSVPTSRPKLSSVLTHDFFSHPLISIHGFLIDLPLKTEKEKEDFFRNLPSQLLEFPEHLVAIQLGALLLSRMVLINSSAQEYLIPRILNPRPDGNLQPLCSLEEDEQDDKVLDGQRDNVSSHHRHSMKPLFSTSTFREHLAPRLLQIFGVRDAQIRLILLMHFPGYCRVFSEESLRTVVLPELLVGIKDTNDVLVSTTLRALAELVPLLGAATVIGGKRGKLFTDGRPKQRNIKSSEISHVSSRPQSSNLIGNVAVHEGLTSINTSLYRVTPVLSDLPERPSPDGGEEKEKEDVEADEEDGLEEVVVDWSDWDAPEEEQLAGMQILQEEAETRGLAAADSDVSKDLHLVLPTGSETLNNRNLENKLVHNDSSLKEKKSKLLEDEDFFKDMEPVILKPQILRIEAPEPSSPYNLPQPPPPSLNAAVSSLSFDSTMDLGEESGWGEDLEWGDEDLEIG